MQILTVVIGLIFVLLLLSLLATTMMELLASLFSLRGRNLIKALRNMLASSDQTETLLTEFQQNSLYRHLTQRYSRDGRTLEAPSYMNAETFQSILFDIILKGDGIENMQDRIDNLPDKDLKNVLNQLLRESGGQLDLFRLEVQNWYNNVMDRAGGWYKRYTQKILIFMGLGIAVMFNADTVALYDRLSNDPETLASLVSAAEQYVITQERADNLDPQRPDPAPRPSPTTIDGGDTAVTAPGQFPDQEYTPVDPFETDQGETVPNVPITANNAPSTYGPGDQPDFRSSLEELKGLLNTEIAEIRRPLGLGWEGIDIAQLSTYDVISKILGFILTALAISLGAPFWFDLLKKLVNIRSAGSTYENR